MVHTSTKESIGGLPKIKYNWTSCVLWRPYLTEDQRGSRGGGTQGRTTDWGSRGVQGAMSGGGRNSRAQILGSTKASFKNQWSPKDCTDHYCFFPSMKSLALPSCNPMVSGKASWKVNNCPGCYAWVVLGETLDHWLTCLSIACSIYCLVWAFKCSFPVCLFNSCAFVCDPL